MVREKRKTTRHATPEAAPDGVVSSFDPSLPLANEGHELFCLGVFNRKSNVKAYQSAYPDAAYMSAAAASSALLKDYKIQARIKYLREEQRERLKMTADDVIMALEMAARFDVAEMFKPDGTMLPLSEMPYEIRACIEKFEHDDLLVGEGKDRKIVGRTSKVSAMSKTRALELLAKHHKLLTDRVEHTVSKTLEQLLAGDDDDAA